MAKEIFYAFLFLAGLTIFSIGVELRKLFALGCENFEMLNSICIPGYEIAVLSIILIIGAVMMLYPVSKMSGIIIKRG